MFEVLHLDQRPGRRRGCRHCVLNGLAKDLRRTLGSQIQDQFPAG